MESAVQAFLVTTNSYGQRPLDLVFSDNPAADDEWFKSQIPSIQASQDRLDEAASTENATNAESDPSAIDLSHVTVSRGAASINTSSAAIQSLVGNGSRVAISIDAEWRVLTNDHGYIIGPDKMAVIIAAYDDPEDGTVRVHVFQVYEFRGRSLPIQLMNLITDERIKKVGVNVGGDLAKIGRDFNCQDKIAAMPEENIINLGLYARRRDVVQNGSIGLAELSRIVLGKEMTKDNGTRISDWTRRDLTDRQKRYCYEDGKAGIDIYNALKDLPDLSARISPDAAIAGAKVDIVPPNGSPACMQATRGAIGTIVGSRRCARSPPGIYPSSVKPKDNERIVRVSSVQAPHLVVPTIKSGDVRRPATLGDCGEVEFEVVVPLHMIRMHVESAEVRPTPMNEVVDEGGSTAAAAPSHQRPRQLNPRLSPTQSPPDEEDDGIEEVEDGEADELMPNLTEEDIEGLRLAIFAAGEASEGRPAPLECPHLDAPPSPKDITNQYSSVLGDGFHAIHRPKVPTEHDSKKAYFVALQEAFYAWDPKKLEELKAHMRAAGQDDKDIEAEMYFNSKFFRACVPRRMLPPKQLYWRVRAVFVTYGGKRDAKSNKPLFNDRAWTKANNILTEILAGYYSDPPGYSFYSIKTKPNGEADTNKYGMVLYDCDRSTSGTEAKHKQYVGVVGTWNMGVEMSDCVMGEHRHRSNHRQAERRRQGFPKIGHSDTWLVDGIQNLVLVNHGTLLYPNWSNASDFRDTEESFGTVALHNRPLQDAVETAYKRIQEKEEAAIKEAVRNNADEEKRKKAIAAIPRMKLTSDQKYIADAMGVPMPFLPFHGEKEHKERARFLLDPTTPKDDDARAVAWCKLLDGIDIMPKLPVHFRNAAKQVERNERVKSAVRKARDASALLSALNSATLQPTEAEVNESASANDGTAAPAQIVTQSEGWALPRQHRSLQPPAPAARAEVPNQVVGGTNIGQSNSHLPQVLRKQGQRGSDATQRAPRTCKSCKKGGGNMFATCPGRTSRGVCQYYNKDGQPK